MSCPKCGSGLVNYSFPSQCSKCGYEYPDRLKVLTPTEFIAKYPHLAEDFKKNMSPDCGIFVISHGQSINKNADAIDPSLFNSELCKPHVPVMDGDKQVGTATVGPDGKATVDMTPELVAALNKAIPMASPALPFKFDESVELQHTINTMVARSHIAESLLKAYIEVEVLYASCLPPNSVTAIVCERKIEKLNKILEAVDHIDDFSPSQGVSHAHPPKP